MKSYHRGSESMNWSRESIGEEIDAFIIGWGYCRKVHDTEIDTTGDIKTVKFGEKTRHYNC
ncbi:hypothetical protein SAMN05216216_10622 [Lacicoccus qingdaonensis]|uniref:Uncharacterized protein n=1 Tax=Lacicoccus qingdaonensis TaxID=576118 RepID=A0A1G9DIY0_9BACL|nr:hypothetical protein SAMN05216216_10622 [Salinicoccus qingdaonensis]